MRERTILLAIAFAFFAAVPIIWLAAWFSMDPVQQRAEYMRSVVKITAGTGHGSGVHLGNGFILTAGHVADMAPVFTITSKDGKTAKARVLWSNHASDVALLRTEEAFDFPASKLQCEPAKVGQSVRLEGNPSDTEFATSWGRVSAFGKTGFENLDGLGLWKTLVTLDMTAAPGTSGGPIFDGETDNIVGILVSGMQTPRGTFAYTFMVPSTEICAMFARVA